ncbi:DUF5993 family protein [Glaciimonas sp. Gout2]|uniref:DUF5993 family protein n=1 Tax=unclassified Glaciimonas TaxID=2644401 RepID=UPI002AB47FA5|nr:MULTISPECIES: DUF5993 family protein [unclassified Glaciimonas]MDY7545191.1 DUF5993 family protein [Glaciimonas sp. CA11.2]MEB0011310.1 DUF5993 family protein [Glaciimonas sp. Cout2]MEB0080960.1 DUF5993 family protein [Glaciimonas sp. Gout2]
MFMFLPFLIALLAVLSMLAGKEKIGLGLWLTLLIVTIASFNHHATSSLNLSF